MKSCLIQVLCSVRTAYYVDTGHSRITRINGKTEPDTTIHNVTIIFHA
jgi:hypothetical protein